MKRPLAPLTALLSGALFGTGLIVSGMTNPAIVHGFLDITGHWNPALLFTMVGAAVTTFVGFRLVRHCKTPLCGSTFHWPTKRDIDRPLLLGSALFGIGWGLAGYCPGPALVGLSTLNPNVFIFVLTMLAGMVLTKTYQNRKPHP